jgi:hypothetical protein
MHARHAARPPASGDRRLDRPTALSTRAAIVRAGTASAPSPCSR